MKFDACGKTDTGSVRETNEDRLLVDTRLGLLAVADGMGGHAAGEVAAALAINGIHEELRRRQKEVEDLSWRTDRIQAGLDLMLAAVNGVCAEIYSLSRFSDHCRGMGTTLTAVLIAGNQAVVAHVGDSRLYLLREGSMRQVTSDHTLLAELVRKGLEPKKVVSHHRFAHMLVRAIGQEPPLDIETHVIDIQLGDKLLLCTDGLSNYFDDARHLVPFLTDSDCDTAAGRLVDAALARGGVDNVSAVVVAIAAAEDPKYGVQRNGLMFSERELSKDSAI